MVRDLNDFLRGAETLKALEDLLEKFFSLCHARGINLNPCKFCITLEGDSLVFMGIQVSSEGYRMDPARLDAIRNFPRPMTSKQMQ